MPKKTIKLTDEFKKEAVELVTEQDYSQAEASRRLGINAKNLNLWIRESEETNRKLSKTTKEEDDLVWLRKEVKRLKMEREILKTAAFFANESN